MMPSISGTPRLVSLLVASSAVGSSAREGLDAVALVQRPLLKVQQPLETVAVATPGTAAAEAVAETPLLAQGSVPYHPVDGAAARAAGLCHHLATRAGSVAAAAWRRAGDEREGLRQAFFMLLVFGAIKGYALIIRPDRKAEEMLLGAPQHQPLPRISLPRH
mmetsp:Transcript_83710/g.194714  ORF Transcript_83710/g.194714 Transcript_83710/m.194714 type:complete len:162 (-) Transcript_83710:65-550(-)